MTDVSIRSALASAVADVLERMFFLDALDEAAEPQPAADEVAVRLTFDGDPPGAFQLRLSRAAADAIAADFLGEDSESLTAEQRTDVTLELANMICGAVLSRIESSATFRLGPPELVAGEGRTGLAPQVIRHTVEIGSGTLTVAIQLEERSCPATARYVS